ncbi:unnamed protein product [Blepharisma stoltei]|uniref:SCP domain-containing protein n=1 Tax=Blepharisma stoltei TaxID=1481888 RepID=A0AAU9IVN5_9CILI|nr:unnamed protein product [Blepharisma stoltei]
MPSYSEIIQEIFNEINVLRTNPLEFAEKVEKILPQYKTNNARHRPGAVPVITREGKNAAIEAINLLKNTEPLNALKWSEGLARAAQAHCNDSGSLGIIGHIGSRENSLQDRLEHFGKWDECIAEALDYGSVDGFETILTFLIDDGLSSRPHRQALLNPKFNMIGIGFGPHLEYKSIGCIVYAGDFKEKDDMENVEIPDGEIRIIPEVYDWLDGAVKVTCEVRTESDGSRSVRKVKKHWEMADGSTQITEDTVRTQRNPSSASED